MKRSEPRHLPADVRAVLSSGTAVGARIQDDWLTDPDRDGAVTPERRVMKRNGRTGRIDVFVQVEDGHVAVIEIKNTDWDAMRRDRVRPNVLRHIRQVYGYMDSELEGADAAARAEQRARAGDGASGALWDVGEVTPGLIYTRSPADHERQAEIEAICDAHLISVVWHDEVVDARRARAQQP